MEAAQIVNAVVDAFSEQTKGYGTGATKLLKADLDTYKLKLEGQIRETQKKLLELAAKGNVEFQKPMLVPKADENEQAPQPSFNSLSLDQYRSTKDHLMQTEFALMDLGHDI